jgi:hypothetical protein
MTGAPAPKHYSPLWNNDTRPAPPAVGCERETLSAVLDWHRATFELKCAGLPPERLSEQAGSREVPAIPEGGLRGHLGSTRHDYTHV